MERVTSSDDCCTSEENDRLDYLHEETCPEATKTICTQNQINDLIIATEVNKILLTR